MLMEAKKKNPWGASLKKLRKSKGLTQERAAELLDIPLSSLRNWEQGRTAPPAYIRPLIESVIRGAK